MERVDSIAEANTVLLPAGYGELLNHAAATHASPYGNVQPLSLTTRPALSHIVDDVCLVKNARMHFFGIEHEGRWYCSDVQYVPYDWAHHPKFPFKVTDDGRQVFFSSHDAKITIKEPVLFLNWTLASGNFAHFIHDLLLYASTYHWLSKHIPGLRVICPKLTWENQRYLVTKYFGDRVIYFDPKQMPIDVDHLYVSRRLSRFADKASRSWHISFSGARFLQPKVRGNADPSVRVYLKREWNKFGRFSAPQGRIFSNTEEVDRLFVTLGFLTVDPGAMPQSQLMSMLERAVVVAGVHGAGLANLVFSSPGANVVEIEGMGGTWRCFQVLSNVLGLRHRVYRPTASDEDGAIVDTQELASLILAK